MRWEDQLLDLFDDLEQQAEGLALAERDAEVAELRRSEYAQVDFGSRLFASLGRDVRLTVTGHGVCEGRLARVGDGWCLLVTAQGDLLVSLCAVTAATRLSERAVPPEARAVTARLGLGSALRGVAEGRRPVVVHRTDGGRCEGVIGRVGADFVEVVRPRDGASREKAQVELVPFGAVAVVAAQTG